MESEIAVVGIGGSIIFACISALGMLLIVSSHGAFLNGPALLIIIAASFSKNGMTGGIEAPKNAEQLRMGDRVGTRLVAIAIKVYDHSDNMDAVSNKDVRALIRDLTILTRDAQRFAVSGVPWGDRETRQIAMQAGSRLAGVIGAHRQQLLTTRSSEKWAAIAGSLTALAGAWALGDLEAKIRDAPDFARPQPFKKLLPPLVFGGFLIALGFGVPHIPWLRHTASSLQPMLWSAAALTLISGFAQVPDYIMTLISKVIAPK